jgi:hypothetical protein
VARPRLRDLARRRAWAVVQATAVVPLVVVLFLLWRELATWQLILGALGGTALGLALGVGLAALWERLDPRAQPTLPSAGRPRRAANTPSTRAEPHAKALEPALRPAAREGVPLPPRVAGTNVEELSRAIEESAAHIVALTSEGDDRGRTVLAANLAVHIARSGKRVALAELGSGRNGLSTVFGLEGRPGVAAVALGRMPLEEALAPIALDRARGTEPPADALTPAAEGALAEILAIRARGAAALLAERRGEVAAGGALEALVAGSSLPLEQLAPGRVGVVVSDLARRADVVLLVAPRFSSRLLRSVEADLALVARRAPVRA